MTTTEAIRKAIAERDIPRLARIVERARLHGARYDDLLKASGLELAEFDALMEECDDHEGSEP